MTYKDKAQKYSDLGSVLLETISSQLPSLAELDVSYCESLVRRSIVQVGHHIALRWNLKEITQRYGTSTTHGCELENGL